MRSVEGQGRGTRRDAAREFRDTLACPRPPRACRGWVEAGDSGKMVLSSPELLAGREVAEIGGYPATYHVRDFLDCVKTRRQPKGNADAACNAHIACHAANIALFLGRKVQYDPKKNEFIGDEAANRLRSEAEPARFHGSKISDAFRPEIQLQDLSARLLRQQPDQPGRGTVDQPLLESEPQLKLTERVLVDGRPPRAEQLAEDASPNATWLNLLAAHFPLTRTVSGRSLQIDLIPNSLKLHRPPAERRLR